MKVRIRKRFRDKETGNLMIAGHYAEFEDGRAIELSLGGFVELATGSEVREKSDSGHIPKNDNASHVKRGRKLKL